MTTGQKIIRAKVGLLELAKSISRFVVGVSMLHPICNLLQQRLNLLAALEISHPGSLVFPSLARLRCRRPVLQRPNQGRFQVPHNNTAVHPARPIDWFVLLISLHMLIH